MTDEILGVRPGQPPKAAAEPAKTKPVPYPKWIAPHPSHVENGTVPGHPHVHVDRNTGSVTVLVSDQDQEEHYRHKKDPKHPAPAA